MKSGLIAGLTWGLDTVILNLIFLKGPLSVAEAATLALFVSTFLHDLFSSIWMLIYMGIKKQYKNVIRALKTKSGKFIILGAILGGPIGMSGYVGANFLLGPAYAAIISSLFPALGALLSYIFLKEKMKPLQLFGLFASIAGVAAIGAFGQSSADIEPKKFALGIVCGLICCFGWAIEAVILAYGLKDPNVTDEQALQIRQLTSAIFYGVIIFTVISIVKPGDMSIWNLTSKAFLDSTDKTAIIIAASALFGTASYIFYYKAITQIGAAKAMALNITYNAWVILFSFIVPLILKDYNMAQPAPLTIVFGIVVIIGSLLASSDIKEYFSKKKDA